MKKSKTKKTEPEQTEQHDPAIFWLSPQAGRWDTCTWHRWDSECGRYRAMRLESTISGPDKFAGEFLKTNPQHGGGEVTSWDVLPNERMVDNGAAVNGTYARDFRTLNAVLSALEAYHCDSTGVKTVTTNRDEVVAAAEKMGLSTLREQATTIQKRGTPSQPQETKMASATVVTLDRKQLVPLLENIGVHTARKHDKKLMGKRLVTLAKMPAEERTPTRPDMQRLMDEIVAAVEAGDKIELTGWDGKPAEKAAAPKTRAASKPSSNGKTHREPKAAKTAKEGVKLDRFGARVGSKASAATSVLTKTPKKMEQIIKDAGLPSQQNGYLNKLVGAKLIGKSKEGFFLLS